MEIQDDYFQRKPDDDYRRFLAFTFYAMECRRHSNIPCRWGTLRKDLKRKFLRIADKSVEIWLSNEKAAKEARKAGIISAFFL